MFRNELNKDARARGLSVLVLDSHGNYTQQGAVVRFYDAQGKVLGSRVVPTGGGYNAQSARPIYFGLAKLQPISVEVTFMGAPKRSVQVPDVSMLAGQPLRVLRPATP
ncbi:hypothetical protein [Aliiglaciecola aliphaticivorans]